MSSGGLGSSRQGDRGHQPGTTHPSSQQERRELGLSRLHTHNLESAISFIFFGEVNFESRDSLGYCSVQTRGNMGKVFGARLYPEASQGILEVKQRSETSIVTICSPVLAMRSSSCVW